jgi:hypothetical protein
MTEHDKFMQELQHRRAVLDEALTRRQELIKHKDHFIAQLEVYVDHLETTAQERRAAKNAFFAALEAFEVAAIKTGQWEGEMGIIPDDEKLVSS